jgi:hypothetical protein
MGKKYKLKKIISSPLGCADVGTESVLEDGYFCFPYKDKQPIPGQMWGNSFRIAKDLISEFEEEWVEEIKEPTHP